MSRSYPPAFRFFLHPPLHPALSIAFLLCGAWLAGAPGVRAQCTPEDTTLCLFGGRFAVEVDWVDRGTQNTHAAHMVSLSDDQGYAWFLSAAEVETVIRMVDARQLGVGFWVFAASLSDLEFTLRITDTTTGTQQEYVNPAGELITVADTQSFADSLRSLPPAPQLGSQASPMVVGDEFRLLEGRFAVSVDWSASRTGDSGIGIPVPISDQSGYFWFFSPTGVDLMVKFVDARSTDARFWLYAGPLTDVEYMLTVTDLATGVERIYRQEEGSPLAFVDRRSFPDVVDLFTNGFESGDVSGWTAAVAAP